jgi:hypothetical protein
VPRSELDALTEHVKRFGAGGLVWAFVQEDGSWRSPVAKFLSDGERAAMAAALAAAPGDLLLIVADTEAVASAALGELRLELARRFALVPENRHNALWIVDFPMFEFNEAEQRWDALHHPFTAPLGSFDDPGSLLSRAYDIVLDGVELGSGSIRINRPDVQRQVFDALGFRGRGEGALRLPARCHALGGSAARGHRARHRPHRGHPRRPRIDPRRDRLSQDRERSRSAHRRPRGRRPQAAGGAGRQAHRAATRVVLGSAPHPAKDPGCPCRYAGL